MVHALQRSAGNRAVAAAIQRFTEPPKPVPVTPLDDPKFAAVKAQITDKGRALKKHPAPKAEAKQADDAAVAPSDDKEAQAKAAQADTMSAAKPGGFDKAGFVAAVKAAVAAKAPKNLDEADKFSESGKADEVKAEVAGKVTAGKENSVKAIKDTTAAAPDPSKATEKPTTPLALEKAPMPGAVDAAKAMPSKAPAQQLDFTAPKNETDAKMAEAGVTEQTLANSNEPEFTGALAAKKEGERHSASAPGEVREKEGATLTETQQAATATGRAGLAGLVQTKAASLAKGANQKSAHKAKDEAERARVAGEIKSIFDATKKDVEATLNSLDGEVGKRFDEGEKKARSEFTADHKRRMEKYKDDRYSGVVGKARWLADEFAGLPAEANNIYQEAKNLYESRMEQVISTVADFIGAELAKAKDRIAQGREAIKKYVAAQPKSLQKFAAETSQQFSAQFDQLESDVDSKQEALVDDLATRYAEARNAVDEEITAEQEKNKGLWDKAVDAVGGVIGTILKLKDMLLNVLSRAANAIGKIIKDPIGFLGNLVNAVKGGIENFVANIADHLKKGLQSWLLGSLAEGGIELPEKFDLKGIIKLIMSMLGVTWAHIRSRIVKRIGEPVMSKVEAGVEWVKMVISEGIGGIWRWVLEKLGDIKEMVMNQIRDFVITKIVKAGITWLISLLNPAAAFIKACKMIYDVVMFFVEKASQIKEFVDSILDSVESIASGGVGAVAGYIEKTLSKMVPVLLGFLASLLGLGGISDKIKDILNTIRKPVNAVVDGLVGAAVKYGKKFLTKLKSSRLGQAFGRAKDKALAKLRGGDDSPEGKQQRLDKGVADAAAAMSRFGERPVAKAALTPMLGLIKRRYGLTRLEPVVAGEVWEINAAINPTKKQTTPQKVKKMPTTLAGQVQALRDEARTDPTAVDRLYALFEAQQRAALVRYAATDPVAKQVLAARDRAKAQQQLETASGSSRPQHHATAKLTDRAGHILWTGEATSGGMAPSGDRSPGWRARALQASLDTHTEVKIINAAPLAAGCTLFITGQYDPCPACQTAMQNAATQASARVDYWWPGGARRFT